MARKKRASQTKLRLEKPPKIKYPAASNGISTLQRCRAAEYLTLTAFAKMDKANIFACNFLCCIRSRIIRCCVFSMPFRRHNFNNFHVFSNFPDVRCCLCDVGYAIIFMVITLYTPRTSLY